ncbi:MAG: L-histidine N(alpha)-methyltransferase [Candidatus Micrarchaeota archaeon]|nr:L-histidine N(alpha)-methyltransferase [Candidatus Micrarchaeota archaeon]
MRAEGLIDERRNSPTFLSVHMRPVCNFRCQKCFMGDMRDIRTGNRPLDFREVEKIAKNGRAAGVRVFGITGAGEPLVDRLTPDAVSIASDMGFITHLATNAALLDERKLKFLRDKDVTLVVSLDTTDPKEFARKSGTDTRTFRRVVRNLRLAQEVFAGTSEVKEVDGKRVQVFRLAVHSTASGEKTDEVERIRELIDDRTTLFSTSPIATVKSAKANALGIGQERTTTLSEQHIVVTAHPATGKQVCGFFLFGIDINFDGELLLDAHAIDSRNLISNIRDFNFDVGRAFSELSKIKDGFVARFLEGFCPVRTPKLDNWLASQKRDKLNREIAGHIKNGQSLVKFAYLGQGAERFLKITESPQYPSAGAERGILAANERDIRGFMGENRAVVLGAGDRTKLQHVLGRNTSAVFVDISRKMLEVSKAVVDSPELMEADFERIDPANFGPNCTFVILGNTLGNIDDMGGFLKRIATVPNARVVVGMELVPDCNPSSIARVMDEYNNEDGFQFVFTPLERFGVKRSDGEITVRFNQEKMRIEEFFEFRNDEARGKFAKEMGLDADKVQKIPLSISSKLGERQFLELMGASGFVVEKSFRQGTNFVFLLSADAARNTKK